MIGGVPRRGRAESRRIIIPPGEDRFISLHSNQKLAGLRAVVTMSHG